MSVREALSKPVFVPVMPRSFWDRDPEVASFVQTLFGKYPLVDLPSRVEEAFPGRAPSKSAIFRYIQFLRGRPAKGFRRS